MTTALLHQRTPVLWDEDEQTLEIIAPSYRSAYAVCRRVAGTQPVAFVTPTIPKDAPSPLTIPGSSPLVLVAAPSQFELCEVRADRQIGRCVLIVRVLPQGVLQ